jgi:hypothetical protein
VVVSVNVDDLGGWCEDILRQAQTAPLASRILVT